MVGEALVSIILIVLMGATVAENAIRHDYGDALSKSLLFFEGQRSRKLPSNQRLTWRRDSALRDDSDEGYVLSNPSLVKTTHFLANADNFVCDVLPESPIKSFKYSPGGLMFKPGVCNMQHTTTLSFLTLTYDGWIYTKF